MNVCSECGGVGGCEVGCAGPPRAKPHIKDPGYVDWKLTEWLGIGYAIGRSFPTNPAEVLDANQFGQYFAERTTRWGDLDKLYDQFRKEAAA